MEKRHHYVPRFYLSYFAAPTHSGGPPVVWVYDKDRREPRAQQPKDTAVIGRLYTIQTTDGDKELTIEQILANLESRVKPILDRWQKPQAKPEAREIPIIADFLSTLHGRVPRAMEMAEELGRAFLLAKLKHLAQDPEPLKQLWEDMRRNRRPPEGFTFEMFRESLMEFEQRFKLSLNPTVRMGLGLLQAKRMFPELLEMTWCLCRAPSDSFFITSDAPVNVFVPRGPKALFGAGYGLEAVEIGFAVSPQVCLYLRRRQGQLRRRASRAFVTEMNRRTACMAERFVFSHLKSRATNTLVTSFSFTRELPKVNREDIERRMRARDKVGEA